MGDIENPPAFPTHPDGDGLSEFAGMTLRDWFAGQALAGVGKHLAQDHQYVAQHCYGLADAMLAARREGRK